MKTKNLYHVVFEDGSESRGLTFKEAEQAMKEGEESGNDWIRVFCEAKDYTTTLNSPVLSKTLNCPH